MSVPFGVSDWQAAAPFSVVAGAAIVVLLYEAFLGDERDATALVWLSLLGLSGGLATSIALWGIRAAAFGGTFALDGFALFTNVLCILAAAMTILMAYGYLETINVRAGEFYPLVLFATSGMMIMGAARDLIVLFLGLEIMSVAAYVLAGIHRRDRKSGEAALKYFLLGAFATGFLLYGIAILYGATGATSYAGIAAKLPQAPRLAVFAGVALLLVALGFKVSAVPFHFWAPDVYEGSPTAVTAFMAVGIKAAAFAGFARFFLGHLLPIQADWGGIVWWLAVLTMTVGNVVAIAQKSIKRMLAYSSIAHAGYLLVAVASGNQSGGAAVLFYLLAYAFMNLGAFAVVIALGAAGEPNEDIADYAGLSARQPALAAAMAVFMLSLTGVPPFAGFVGKLYIFSAAVQSGYVGLAVIGVLNSAGSAYYYIRILVEMYMRDSVKQLPSIAGRPYLVASIAIAAVGTVLLGVFPSWAVELARASFLSVR
jgi:NADH-quinone oxidoreductase subunit N